MKTILTKFLALSSVALLMLASCKKDGAIVKTNGGKPGALTASTTSPVLDKSKLSDTTKIINFSFSQPSFGYAAAVTNTLQIDAPGDNWKNPASVTLGTKVLSQGYSTADFNALLLKLNLVGGVPSTVNVRVQHSLSADVTPVYSNVVALNVTPFNLAAWLYVVGQFNGYSTAAPDSILSATSNGIFTGIINFPAVDNQFLILPKKNFDNKYATTESPNTTAASLTYSTEYVTGGGNNLVAPATAGNYLITLNTNANTITVAPVNAYSVIGTVTPHGDFSTDIDLKFINSIDQDWEGVFPFTNGTFPGSFKVRQNHDWTWSWGIPQATTTGFGIANTLNDSKNDNIPITASGNYKVTFSIPTTPFSISNPPSVTAIYTVKAQ
jgi:starch-binding outer membrane protein SusE/F